MPYRIVLILVPEVFYFKVLENTHENRPEKRPFEYLLESPSLEPLLRTLLRTLPPSQTHCGALSWDPSWNLLESSLENRSKNPSCSRRVVARRLWTNGVRPSNCFGSKIGTGKRGHYERGLFTGGISKCSRISRISKCSRISRKSTFLKRPLFQKTPFFSEPEKTCLKPLFPSLPPRVRI